MKLKGILSAIIGGLLGVIILIGAIGFIDWFLTSRQTLNPGEVAIIREVWKKEGSLIGPSAPPYEVRVVENNSSQKITFFIQPYPFGYVEEIINKEEIKKFSFDLPLWTKDTITHNPNDASIARVLFGKGKFKVKNARLYAKNLDYLGLPYAKEGDILYPVKTFLRQRGIEPEVNSREELLSEIVHMDFSQFLSVTVNKWNNSIAQKYTLLAKSMKEENITSKEEKEKFIADFLKKYPWYRLEPEALEKLRENPEVQKLLQNYFEALRSEKPLSIKYHLGQIQKFFANYIRENPEAYDKEKWEYVKSLLLQPDKLPEEYKLEFVYPFVENRIKNIQNDYIKSLRKLLSEDYGVELISFKVEAKDDLSARYPYLLMERG